MNPGLVKISRDHRDPVLAVTAHAPEVGTPAREHPVPAVKHLVGKRIFRGVAEVDHEIGDTGLGWTRLTAGRLQSEMPEKRCPQILAVKILPLDLGSLKGFFAYNLRLDPVPLMLVKTPVNLEKQVRPAQEITLRALEEFRFACKIRPLGLLPVPSHEP